MGTSRSKQYFILDEDPPKPKTASCPSLVAEIKKRYRRCRLGCCCIRCEKRRRHRAYDDTLSLEIEHLERLIM